MTVSRSEDQSKALFEAVMPLDPRITVKPMFGSLAGFINGNMFIGQHGHTIFMRLPEALRLQLLEEGAVSFSPMPGRSMLEYIAVPDHWQEERIAEWTARSLSWAETLPEKVKKRADPKKKNGGTREW